MMMRRRSEPHACRYVWLVWLALLLLLVLAMKHCPVCGMLRAGPLAHHMRLQHGSSPALALPACCCLTATCCGLRLDPPSSPPSKP